MLMLGMLASCTQPRPVEPAQIAAARQQPRPSWIAQLQLPAEKAERVAALSARVGRAFQAYDLARLILLKEVLAEIRQGQLDRVKLQPLAERMLLEFDKALPTLLIAANELHHTLDRAERARLVEMFGGGDADQTPEERQKAREERIERVLDLTTGQKTQLFPALLGVALGHWGLLRQVQGDFRQAKEQFLSEEFDARALPLVVDRRPMDVLVAVYEAFEVTLPVLTPAQRDTLIAYMDAHLR